MPTLNEIVKEVSKHSGIAEEEIRKKIEEKQLELSGLVSAEGAAYIVARELGVNLLKETKRQLKIKNIVSGMRSVDVIGRVVNISEKRDFEKRGRSGSVINLTIGDDTGTIRLSLWNDEIGIADDLKEGDIVRVTGGYTKVDSRGNPELRLGKMGRLEKIENTHISLPDIKDIKTTFETIKRKNIADFKEGERNEVRACIVNIFKKNLFFEICPQCELRLEKKDDSLICKEHGNVQPKYAVVISCVIDDGTGNIRAVLFRDVAEKLLGLSSKELKDLIEKDGVEKLFDKIDLLGKEFIFRGRVKRNHFTDRLEFVVNDIEEIDMNNEIKNLFSLVEKIKKLV